MRLSRPASVALDALLSTACCAVGYAALRLGGSPVGFWVGMALAAALIYVARRCLLASAPTPHGSLAQAALVFVCAHVAANLVAPTGVLVQPDGTAASTGVLEHDLAWLAAALLICCAAAVVSEVTRRPVSA